MPYWNVKDTLPCMYAGAISVSSTNKHNLFYWLFKNTNIDNAPLIIWINGGPGSSSMFGLFLENGPIRVTRTGSGVDDYQVGLSPDGSWLEYGDVLYLDQPVGTGFSYGDTYLDRMDDGATEFINFLDAFIKMYPEYQNKISKRKFFLTGESYAGKYIPLFTKYIDDYENRGGQVSLTAVLIGNPFASPVTQRTSTHNVGKALGIIDTYNYDQIAALRR